MTFRNTTRSWGALTKALHWIIVILIIVQFFIASRAHDLPRGPALIEAWGWHKSVGMTIFMLAIIRLVWRWMNPVPDLTAETRAWEHTLAKISHVLLYALIFAVPLTGWLMSSAKNFPVSWFSLFQWPDLIAPDRALSESMESAHKILVKVLVGVALLHAAGALKHHFIDKNNVLRRMLPFSRIK
ncbi:MAG TPA: cytochrome b [Steroidobacteraceae bacterium]|nr:cytochrome b [Steroidobacteraceae bacterium]